MQRKKGPRLWVESRKGRQPIYYIRDGARKVSTGCFGDDLEGATKALGRYLRTNFTANTQERDLAQISCAEVLMLYGRDIAPTRAGAATISYHIQALTPFWGNKTLADVKGSTCRGYTNQRLSSSRGNRSIQPSTVRLELKTLQAAINHWHRESPLVAVPRLTLPPQNPPRERVLERSEVAAMLRACRKLKLPHVARFILIGIYTGTRHAAILGLKWNSGFIGGHIDLDRGVLYRIGKGEKETSKRRPPVRIPRRLHSHLARWRSMDDRSGANHPIHFAGQPILKMKRAWASVVKEAGLGRDVTPHVLRHTAVSWLLWQGWTVWDVAGHVGASPSMIERTYGHHMLNTELKRKRA